MFYYLIVDQFAKLGTLSKDMVLEAESEKECQPVIRGKSLPPVPITEVALPGGKKMKVLKTMLSTACERNCHYCPFRAGRKMRRETFKPEEMAKTFIAVYESGAVEGLFLSSGILKGGVTTQDKLIDTADILRKKFNYRGYMHLKIMPGAEKDQVRRSMQLADRVSVNLEAANPGRLPALAPMKKFAEELLAPLEWAEEIRQMEAPRTWNGRWASTSTQFVVGASGESDLELLSTSEYLYKQLKLKRTYFSAFVPIEDTPLENHPAENPWREHRLYQASFLLRDYGWSMEDLPFRQDGHLPLNKDPKTAWAEQTLLHTPIELNKASREQLMMVPGIGPKGADSILRARRHHKLMSFDDLKKLGVVSRRAAPYVLVDGKLPAFQYRLVDIPDPAMGVPRAFPG
ncbi:MAG TPA: helix-hairpin-helix domain-containing protein [Anaerolineales bacterium]|nr:helix-hairpin-helix domain-containing protein [Anaerolineales bacterium]